MKGFFGFECHFVELVSRHLSKRRDIHAMRLVSRTWRDGVKNRFAWLKEPFTIREGVTMYDDVEYDDVDFMFKYKQDMAMRVIRNYFGRYVSYTVYDDHSYNIFAIDRKRPIATITLFNGFFSDGPSFKFYKSLFARHLTAVSESV
jgi:hypothetical protein